jgi:hypothetical protein
MASKTFVVSGSCDQGGSCTLYGRITSRDGTGVAGNPGEGYALKKADVATMVLRIASTNDVPNTLAPVPAPVITPAATMFDTLQTSTNDAAYGGDRTGFNFRWEVPLGIMIYGGRTYLFQVVVTTVGGKVGYCNWSVTTNPTRMPPQGN